MIPAPFKVVLDANVLYPFSLRDTLLRSAEAGFYQVHWSVQILEEVSRNLVANAVVTAVQAARLCSVMNAAFPEAMVTGHESLIPAMKNHEKDRHVVAAAVKAGVEVIVTNNLDDFSILPEGIEVQSADEFLCNLLDLDPEVMLSALKAQAAALKKPARTFEELLAGLAKTAPGFVAETRAYLASRAERNGDLL